MPRGTHGVAITDENIFARLSVTNEAKELGVRIDVILLKGASGKSERFVSMGERNKSLQMGFPRSLVAILSGVERLLASNPEVEKITLTGGTVINSHLVKFLEENGFRSSRGLGSRILFDKVGSAGALSNFSAASAALLKQNPSPTVKSRGGYGSKSVVVLF